MKVIEKGKSYLLHNSDSSEIEGQIISFSFKDENGQTVNGTKNEELLKVLIHRLTYLNSVSYCKENKETIVLLSKALEALNSRKANKVKYKEQYQQEKV